MKVGIGGVQYEAESWETVQQGEMLREAWPEGWAGGMGELRRRSVDGHYICIGFDPSSYPYLRLPPQRAVEINLPGLNTSLPLYHFQAQDAGGTDFLYVLSGRYAYKINRTTNALIEREDFGSGAQAGRPAIFETVPQVALGDSVDAQVLTTCATPPTLDTWDAKSAVKALAFAVVQDEGTAKLARAHTTNLLDLSADASDWSAADWEAGDSSHPITDLLVAAGEIVVIRPDGPRRFDTKGNSLPVQQFVGQASDTSAIDGACSYAHGAYVYWCHSSGLGRIIGESIDWVGPESDPRWGFRPGLGLNPEPFASGQWRAATAYGRWFYGVHRGELCFGYILGDGRIRWQGVIDQGAEVGRCFRDDGPSLWYNFNGDDILIRLDLHPDGSLRTPLGTKRGHPSKVYSAYLPEPPFGQSPDKEKQLARAWATVEDFPSDGSASLRLGYHRDAEALIRIGDAITADGTFERDPGSLPLTKFYRLIPRLDLSTTGGYTPSTSDPRVTAFGIDARTATIYSTRLLLTADKLKGSKGPKDAIKHLRGLDKGVRVEIKEPEFNREFNGYVVGLQETAVGVEGQSGFGYKVDVLIERWDVVDADVTYFTWGTSVWGGPDIWGPEP